jgi:dienelactone hydrolase
MPDELEGFTRSSFTAGGRTKDVYRTGSGPAILVISEMPGITPEVAAFAQKAAAIGCTAVMPHLFGTPGRPVTVGYTLDSLARVCISREFSVMALGRTSPVISWLRALAGDEHNRCGGPGVGVVGMCLTGGFALGMMVDDTVVAPVVSQPGLPFPVSAARKRDLGISDGDLRRVQERADAGTCVLGLRFSGDTFSPPERFARLRQALGDQFIAIELDSSPGNPYGHKKRAHSVLTADLDDRPGTPTRDAVDSVLTFFADRLLA